MPENERFDLHLEKQRAAERMRELNARSKYRQNAPVTDTHRHTNNTEPNSPPGFLSELNIPFLSNIKFDSDIALILGLVLILSSENSDKLLLLALLYILI